MGTLRILLAIAIIISHTILISHSSLFGITLLDGYSAVRAFFIMSGFYMWMILNEKYIGQNNSYKLFITNRFLRVFPAYWTVLILTGLCMVIGALFFKQITTNPIARYISFGRVFNPLVDVVLIFSNLFIFGQDVLTFLGIDFNHGAGFVVATQRGYLNQNFMLLPQSWALATELIFYLLVPLLVKRSIKLTMALIAIIVAVKFYFYLVGNHYFDWQFPPFEFVYFLLGGVSYFIYTKIKDRTFSKTQLNAVWIIILLYTIFYQYVPTYDLKRWLYYILFAAALPFIFYLTKNYKRDRYIGELSYPFFLMQYLAFGLLQLAALPDKYLGVFSVISCLISAVIIYHFVTIPVERIRQKRVKPKSYKDSNMPDSWKQ